MRAGRARAVAGGGEGGLGLGEGIAELDQRLARNRVAFVGSSKRRRRLTCSVGELLLELEHDPLGGLLADAGDGLEPSRVLTRDRPAELRRRGAGHDSERHLRADAVHGQELDEQLALVRVREAEEL